MKKRLGDSKVSDQLRGCNKTLKRLKIKYKMIYQVMSYILMPRFYVKGRVLI